MVKRFFSIGHLVGKIEERSLEHHHEGDPLVERGLWRLLWAPIFLLNDTFEMALGSRMDRIPYNQQYLAITCNMKDFATGIHNFQFSLVYNCRTQNEMAFGCSRLKATNINLMLWKV